MKNYIIAIFTTVLIASCSSDFLDEEQVATLKYDHYESEEGMEDLVKACYSNLRYRTGYEQCYCLWNFGVDEYTQSDQPFWSYFNIYGTELNASEAWFSDLWSYNYRAIDWCNVGIDKIPKVTGGVGFLKDDYGKTVRLAELRFLRAYYYFMLVQQFGAIPLTLTPSSGVKLVWPRASVAEVYNAIIADFTFAAHNLPETQGEYGRATANAARHYLAKAYLTRGSAVTDERGQQPGDMDSVAYYADLCINSGYNSLLSDYADIFDLNNQKNSEIVFATQFSTVLTLISGSGAGYQNRTHLFWLNQYDVDPGMKRDIAYGRPYRRLMATDYTYNINDRLNDSRLRKALFISFLCNNEASIPKWGANDLARAWPDNLAPDGTWTVTGSGDTIYVGDRKFELGDTALFFLVNDENTTLTDRDIIRMGYTIYARYYWVTDDAGNPVELVQHDTTINNFIINAWRPGKVPSLSKYLDPLRESVNAEAGTRDVFNARLGETYLIAAEAYGRKGDYATAVQRINTLRQRGAYHDGEQKPIDWWKYDGGTKGDVSNTEASMLIDASYWDTNVPVEQYPSSADTKEERFINFILNERCRELLGEMVRWEDLVRTETLYERAYLFNPDVKIAGSMREYHKLRPIPQAHIELLYNESGKPLSAEERIAYQNPGY